MDWRVKTFEAEALAAFAFLVEDWFAVQVEPSADASRRPTSISLRFSSGSDCVETRLELGFAGEDAISTHLLAGSASIDIGSAPAHKGHELTKALNSHADHVRRLLLGRVPGRRDLL